MENPKVDKSIPKLGLGDAFKLPSNPALPTQSVSQIITPTPNQSNEKPAVPAADKTQVMELEVEKALENIRGCLARTEEDPDQRALVDAVQESKALLLNFATLSYIQKPNNPKMLEAITSLIAGIEKTVRDDRKEKAKEKEKEDDKVSFNQMLDAMKEISSGNIQLPSFNIGSFILDPSKSLTATSPTINPITPAELTQGNGLVDLKGEVVN